MSKYTRIGIFGFFGGVALGSLFGFGFWSAVFIIFLSGLVFGVSRLSFGKKPFLGRSVLSLILLSFALGMLRIELAPAREDSVLKNMLGKQDTFEGVVVHEPDTRENSVHLVVRVTQDEKTEKILLVVRRYPEFEYGDKVRVFGKLTLPKNFKETNGRTFDYVSYLEKDGIFSMMNFPNVEVVAHGEGNKIVSSLFVIKHAFLDGVSQVVPEPHSSLLGGLLVGAKHSLGKELETDFRTAGVIHIIVLSGYNITLVAYFFMSVFSFFTARFRAASGVASIFLFTIMTGAGAATVRASLMAGLIVFARATGRTADVLHLLFIAGFFMVLWNPHILLHDPSFQLSFLATLGLLLLSEKISTRITFIPKKFLLREITAATLSTQIFVLPLLLYQTGQLSLVALPANLFILSAIPGAMLFGFLTGITSFISISVASLFGFITYLFLAYILGAVNFFSHLPFATVSVPEFPLVGLLGMYALLGIFVWKRYAKKDE